jgi:hypothetical protein
VVVAFRKDSDGGQSLRAGGGGNQLKARRLRVCFEATGRVRVTPDLAALVVRDAGLEVLPQDKNLPRRPCVDSLGDTRNAERGKKDDRGYQRAEALRNGSYRLEACAGYNFNSDIRSQSWVAVLYRDGHAQAAPYLHAMLRSHSDFVGEKFFVIYS